MTKTMDTEPLVRTLFPAEMSAQSDKTELFKRAGYEPTGYQKEMHDSSARFKALRWGRRAGKSHSAGHDVLPDLLLPKTIGWIVAPEYKIGEKEFRPIWQACEKLSLLSVAIKKGTNYDPENGDMKITFPWSLGPIPSVQVKSSKYPDTLVGEGLDWLIMSEAAKQKASIWQKYLRPSLSDRRGRAIFPTTPEGKNWFKNAYDFGQDPAHPQWYSSWVPSWENPYLDLDEIDEAKQTLTKEFFEQEYGAEWTSFAGQVYTDFDENIHVVDYVYDNSLPSVAMLDFGWTNPCVVLHAQVDGNDNVYIYSEFVQSHVMPEDMARVVALYPNQFVFGDPAGAQREQVAGTSVIEELARWGVIVSTNRTTIAEGVAIVSRALQNVVSENGHGGLYIDRSCQETISNFNELRYPETKEGAIGAEFYMKDGNDHTMDALRYGMCGLFLPMMSSADIEYDERYTISPY